MEDKIITSLIPLSDLTTKSVNQMKTEGVNSGFEVIEATTTLE